MFGRSPIFYIQSQTVQNILKWAESKKKTPIILDRIITDWTFILPAPSRQRKSFFDVVKEERESDGKGLVCYYSIEAYRVFGIRHVGSKMF